MKFQTLSKSMISLILLTMTTQLILLSPCHYLALCCKQQKTEEYSTLSLVKKHS